MVGEAAVLGWLLLTAGTKGGANEGAHRSSLACADEMRHRHATTAVDTSPPAPPRSKPPPPPPKMVWNRIDGLRGPEVTQQTEVDFATCKELAGTLAAQLQQGDTLNLNLRACMGQHGYKAAAQ